MGIFDTEKIKGIHNNNLPLFFFFSVFTVTTKDIKKRRVINFSKSSVGVREKEIGLICREQRFSLDNINVFLTKSIWKH